ncbi:MAG: cupin domain-containing protein [Desulfarculus sp.]|jgi:mannose-6-phosphate isomerase-like protein (cupin superfamily)|nr:MAG: cupin domain-containing protein [Desulfarculus sp.]
MIIKKTQQVPAEKYETPGYQGVSIRFLWTADDGDLKSAMRLYEIEPGGCTAFHEHYEDHQWLFLDGQGAYVDGQGKQTLLSPGDTLYVPPDEKHQLKNMGQGVLKLICVIPIHPGGTGKGFAPRPAES